MSDLIFTQEKHIGLVLLNRPNALNALNLSMILELKRQLTAWINDDSVHAVVVHAVEGKAFCAGGDIRQIYAKGKKDNADQVYFFQQEYELNQLIYDYPKPYIALMDGITMGGGVGISLHGSHPVASERFIFAMPETGIGFFPDIGASYLLARCPNHMGYYLGLTGHRIHAQDARELGFIQHTIPANAFPEVLRGLIESDLSSNPKEQVTAYLASLTKPLSTPTIHALQPLVDACFSAETVESIIQRLQENGTSMSLEIIQQLTQKSPLSLKVTLQQLRKAADLSFSDCLAMDKTLMKHFMQGHDFYEGVRALLIDKDKSPQWRPETLNEVSLAEVGRYFAG